MKNSLTKLTKELEVERKKVEERDAIIEHQKGTIIEKEECDKAKNELENCKTQMTLVLIMIGVGIALAVLGGVVGCCVCGGCGSCGSCGSCCPRKNAEFVDSGENADEEDAEKSQIEIVVNVNEDEEEAAEEEKEAVPEENNSDVEKIIP